MGLYIFDKDGTLVQFVHTKIGIPRCATKPEEQVLIQGVFEKVQKLRAAGHLIAIASNQTDVARGVTTLDQSKELLRNCAAKVGGVDAWRMSPYDPKGKPKLNGKSNPFAHDDPSRKPHPGMILAIMKELGCTPAQTTMIGDKKMDHDAAEAAGVRFIRAKDFFKNKKGRKHG